MRPNSLRRWAALALAAYAALILGLTLMAPSYVPPDRLRLTPLASIVADVRAGGLRFLINILGNLVAFLPFGLLVPIVVPRLRTLGAILVLGALFSALIETLQWRFTLRVADIDDVLLNALGAGAGYLCFALLQRPPRVVAERPR